MELPQLLIFVIFGGLVLALAIFGWYQSHKRRNALAEWAAARGWTFDVARRRDFEQLYPDFDCLRQGSGRYAFNLLNGQQGDYACQGFDYHYETYSTDSKGNRQTQHHYFSALVVTVDVPLKLLAIRPETVFDKVGQLLGFSDIEFESDRFNREFHVRAPDRRWAFDVLHQETMEFLLAAPRFSVQLSGAHVIAYRSRLFQPIDFEQAIDVATGIIDRLPAYLHHEWKQEF